MEDYFQNLKKVFCIFSDERVFRSKSPALFTNVMEKSGISGVYVPFMVARSQLGQAMNSMRVLNIAGANITMPYKELVIPHLDGLSEGATVIGAVNTIVPDGDILKGYNTNAIGFMDTLEDAGFDVKGKRALVFGSGGAARAVIFILNWLAAGKIIICGRNQDKLRRIENQISGEACMLDDLKGRKVEVDLIVNATSVSSASESQEMSELINGLDITGCSLMIDMNYGRATNLWQAKAAANHVPFLDGIPSLANQARRSLALWTGVRLDAALFKKELETI